MTEQKDPVSRNASAPRVLQEERYLWMARAFVVMLVLAVICDLILLIALSNVTPVMRVQPFYVEMKNKEQQTISVSRLDANTLNSDALKDSLVRQYLMARFGITSDLKELDARWGDDGPVFWMSSESVYKAFLDNEYKKLFEAAQQDNLIRYVNIRSLNKKESVGETQVDEWVAELEFADQDRVSIQPQLAYFTAEIATVFRPVQRGMTWKDRLKNPLGFTIVNFGLQRNKEKSQK